jgi:hypothetical protein
MNNPSRQRLSMRNANSVSFGIVRRKSVLIGDDIWPYVNGLELGIDFVQNTTFSDCFHMISLGCVMEYPTPSSR